MERILSLLEQAGCKADLIDAIGQSLVEYKDNIREQFEADYTAKVAAAKKICLEETEGYKRELARRLQIFLETKNVAIENQLIKQSALNESAAMAKLQNVKALLEGVAVNGQDGGHTAALENAKIKIRQLTEERNKAIELANKRNAIAEKVLQRSREIIAENAKLKAIAAKPTIAESHTRVAKPTRLDLNRKSTTPTTTRSTIVENQTRQPAPQPKVNSQGFGINDIAAGIDEDI